MLRVRVTSCFYVLFFLSCNKLYCAAEVSELEGRFTNAFKGATPFYAITAARDTITEAYGPLTPVEKDLVFLMLTGILSGDHGSFIAAARALIGEKERWFSERKAALESAARGLASERITDLIVEEDADSFAKVPAFRGFLGFGVERGRKEECKGALKIFILDSIRQKRPETIEGFRARLREAFGVQSKPSMPVFDTKSKEIFDGIVNHDEKLEKTKHDEAEAVVLGEPLERTAFESYNTKIGGGDPREFFRSVLTNIERICAVSQRIHGEKIQTHPCLIVFNEMFFSKDVPLSADEFGAIERNFRDLTRRHTNVLLHVNFLYETIRPFKEEAEYRAFMAEQARRLELFTARTGKQIFESDRYREGYREYVAQFSDHRPSLNILRNQSVVFWNGSPVTSYLKSSYRTEAERLLQGKLYELGIAEDEILAATDSTPEKVVATLLRNNLSTEICYDLEIGVRKAMATYPAGKVHIVVSNTLSLAQAGRAENLPDHIPLIIHVDPKDQEILLATETRAILAPGTSAATSGDPLHADRFNQFTKAMPLATFRINLTGNNVFIFHIWDLRHCLETASLQAE